MPEKQSVLGGQVFDVLIVGAGVVGCAMARRFALNGAKVALVEKATDILDGASKANSAILHTGFDAPQGSVELGCVQAGYREYQDIRKGLGLGFEQTGAYVVAWNEDEQAKLEGIRAQALENGVADVRQISASNLEAAEPHLSAALGALHVPGEGLIDPWSAPYVYLQQAIENGAEVFLCSKVESGIFDGKIWQVKTARGPIRAGTVINCAGLFGDRIDKALLGSAEFEITPRKGQFVVFDKAASRLLKAVVLPVPTARTKGVVLFRTVFGNLAVGPTAEDQESRTDAGTDTKTLKGLVDAAVQKLPALADMPITATYAGLRPATAFKDYQIKAHPARGWISVGGIRSTGLSGALGIAQHVYRLYEEMGHVHKRLTTPIIPKAKVLAEGAGRDWQALAPGEIVCHCERVTKREIEAALQGPLAARSLAGLKRQTRVTMGRCQGFYCSARLAELSNGKFDPSLAEDISDD